MFRNIEKVKDGIGHRLGSIVQFIATFISGFIVGLLKSWKLSLALLAFSPIPIICLLLLSKVRLSDHYEAAILFISYVDYGKNDID